MRWEEILQAASRGLFTDEKDEGGEVIPSEGKVDSLAYQSFQEPLFGWPWVLKDSGELLPLMEERRQELTVLVIYFYLFQHFHITFFHLTFWNFI